MGTSGEGEGIHAIGRPAPCLAIPARGLGCYAYRAVRCSLETEDSMRARQGSVVLDKRIKTWNFFFWEKGKRRSKKIGTVSQYPTKASAWRAAKPLRDAVENQAQVLSSNVPMVSTLVEQYRAEKMPRRSDTRRSYEVWLSNYIIPKWGDRALSELQARPVELWIESL